MKTLFQKLLTRKYLTRWNFEDCKTRDKSNSFKFRQTLVLNNFCHNHAKKYDDLELTKD